jgi:hypothetical protein
VLTAVVQKFNNMLSALVSTVGWDKMAFGRAMNLLLGQGKFLLGQARKIWNSDLDNKADFE